MQNRTHTCNELRMADCGKTVKLCGWMENVREVSGNLAFVVLRDFYGTTQIVVETEDMMAVIKGLNKESTIAVTGVVRERDSKNPKMETGDIEVVPEKIEVLGRCRYNELPFQINRSTEADETLRLKYRYLDLRNPEVKKNIIMRCNVVSALRSAIVRLQVELKAAGYAPGSADGKFGTKTKKALQAYQVDNKLAKTGEADAATWAAINRTTAGMKISALKKGSSGTQVKYLQRALIGLGYLNGTADGQYGSKTAEAVRDYQRAYGLGVDGSAGKNTMTSIKNTIVALQSDLTRKGYDANGVDGVFGGGTKSAVKAYQRAAGVTVTGIATK